LKDTFIIKIILIDDCFYCNDSYFAWRRGKTNILSLPLRDDVVFFDNGVKLLFTSVADFNRTKWKSTQAQLLITMQHFVI
jgi:hypothetical protein